jgi:hypothetical protein
MIKYSLNAFLTTPAASMALGMQLTSENKCSLKAKDGTATIIFQTPKATANELDLDYDLLLKEGSTAREND